MNKKKKITSQSLPATASLLKCPTGINGLDQITNGGFPRNRSTLVCGGPGCGKTLLATEFLVHGALVFDEPGVFFAFEETVDELSINATSIGFDLDSMVRKQKVVLDHIHIERSENEESGEYDLEGLFARLNYAIEKIGAKRVVLDTLEVLFTRLPNEAIVRSELRRLFRWLKDKGVTSIITAEIGRGQLTRHGLEEYVSDCVVLLEHRVQEQIATRHLRVVKYRGSLHETNKFPFLIGNDGISVLPITSLGLNHKISFERIGTGIPRLDAMLGGDGFFRGSSILLTGTPGTGKTIVAANFAHAAAKRGEKVLFFAFEESPNQIIRNMQSIGLNLDIQVNQGKLLIHSARPSLYGLEMHLTTMFKVIASFQPQIVVIDPITSLMEAGTQAECKGMVTRLVDYLKERLITTLFTSLTHGGNVLQQSEAAMSSLMDSWLLLQDLEGNGERNRVLYVLKARGMAHSNQIREFLISDLGIDLVDAYIGPKGVLTGSARAAQQALENSEEMQNQQESLRRAQALERKRETVEMKINGLRFEYENDVLESKRIDTQVYNQASVLNSERKASGILRQADSKSTDGRGNRDSTKQAKSGAKKSHVA